MRKNILFIFLILTLGLKAQEGTKQLMPGNTDRLWIEFNVFGGNDFGNYSANENERIHIFLNEGEIMHFGMKMNTDENYGSDVITNASRVRFRIKDPDGAIVFTESGMITSGQGFIGSYTQAVTGPNNVKLNGTTIEGGYDALMLEAEKTGNYYIEFDASWTYIGYPYYDWSKRFALEYFDVTVTDSVNNVITNPGEPNVSAGRLWSKGWIFTNTSFDLYPVKAEFYVFTSDEFINKVYYEMKPFSFSFVSNSYGISTVTTDNYIEKAQSKDFDQTTSNISEYRIFLNDPDRMVWPNTKLSPPKVQVWAEDDELIYDYDYYREPMLEEIVTNYINLEKNKDSCEYVSITIFKIEASVDGFVAVLIDIDGGGYSTEGNDRVIYRNMKKGLNFILWDFKNDNDSIIPNADYKASATFLGRGPAHFPLYDVESLSELKTSSVRPFRKLELTNYWDDSQITTWGDDGGAMEETDTVQLVINKDVPRMWTFDSSDQYSNYNGNRNTINSWFHAIDLGLSEMTLRVEQSETKCVDGLAPYVGDVYKYGPKNTAITFEDADLSIKFFDPTDQPLSSIRVLSLPTEGILRLSGTPVVANQVVSAANINFLTYTPTSSTWFGKDVFAWEAYNGSKWSLNHDSIYLIVNTDPTISTLVDQNICTNTSLLNMPFTIGDEDSIANLNVVAYTHNPSLVSNSNILIGGTGINRNITVTPRSNTSGYAIIYIKVDDGLTETIEEFALYVGPDLNFSGDTTVCVDDTLNLVAQEVGAKYEWRREGVLLDTSKTLTILPEDLEAGNYSLTVEKDTCPATRNFSVYIAPLTSFSGDVNICIGEEINLSATETVAEYIWRKDGSIINESKVFHVLDADTTYNSNNYTLEVTKEGCNNTSDPFSISVIEKPDTSLTIIGETVDLGNNGTVTIQNSEFGVTYIAYIGIDSVSSGDGNGGDKTITIQAADLSIGDNIINFTASNGNCELIVKDTANIHVNVLPQANDDTESVNEDDNVNTDVLVNDSGLEDGGVVITITNNPDFGSAVVEIDNTITYTPNPDYNGTDSYTYQIEDADGDIDDAIVTLNVIPVDDIVDAIDDVFAVNEDGTLNENVISNDLNLGDNGITTSLVSNVGNGTLTLNSNGTFTYSPNANYFGSDSFTYQLRDADGDTDDATVTINITSVDDIVVAVDDNYTINEDESLSDNVVTNDLNLGDGTITVSLLSNVTNGTLTLNSNGTFDYTPNANFNGTDVFQYTLRDLDNDTDIGLVTITISPVDDIVVAVDDNYTINEDASLSNNVISNDLNLGDGTISVTLLSNVTNGSLTLNPDGTFNYTPNADFNGTDIFQYTLRDVDNDTDNATVTITINSVNDVVDAVDDLFNVNEDGVLNEDVITNDLNLGDGGISATIISTVSNGTLNLNPNGTFDYTPNPDYNGTDSFDYRLIDGDGDSDDATVTITVNSINDVVNAIDDAFSVNEDGTLNENVITNDLNLGDGGIETTIVSNVSHGTLTLNLDGTFTYIPNANYNGTDSFTYQLSDANSDTDNATVTITIVSVDDIPVANNDAVSTNQDTDVDVSVLTNDTGLGDGVNSITVTIDPANGSTTVNGDNTITYSPNIGFSGINTFTYEVCDNDAQCSSAIVTVTVDNQDDQPVAIDDNASVDEDDVVTIDVLANDQDLFDGGLTVTITSNGSNGNAIVNIDNTITYTPNADYNGSDVITYQVCDGDFDCSSADVNINVIAVNDVVNAIDDAFNVNEDGTLNGNVVTNDLNLGDGGIETAVVSGVSHGTLTLNLDGTFTYSPNPDYNGTDSFTYQLSDIDDSDNATVSINVFSIDDVVNAVNDGFTVNEDAVLNENVIANDLNLGDGGLETTVVTNVIHGVLTLNLNGTFTYTPSADYNGSDSFTYKLTDTDGDVDNATVTITVLPINDAVDAIDDSFTVNEDVTLIGDVIINDLNLGDGGIETTIVSDVSHGTLTLNLDGTFTYIPNANYFGSDSFTYQLVDTDGDSDNATVSITINSVNDVVDAIDDTYIINEDITLNDDVITNDLNLGDGSIETSVISDVSHGTLTLNLNGTFTYIPNADYFGSDSFTYQLSDIDDTDNATVTITINPIDDIVDAVNDAFNVNEDETLNENVITNDLNLGDGGIETTVVSDVSHGTLTLNLDGTFTYIPDADFFGSDNFTYELSDLDNDINTATVNISVIATDDVVNAIDDSYIVNEDGILNEDVLTNDLNLGDGGITTTVVSNVSNGILVLQTNGSFTYTPNADFNGSDSFTYELRDLDDDTDIATVTINITSVNDVVDAIDDNISVNEDQILIDNVTTNDQNLGDGGIIVSLDSDVSHGSLTLNPDGSFTYDSDDNYNGSDSFTYEICDGTPDCDVATVTINVFPVDDVVNAINDSYVINEDETLNDDVITNDLNLGDGGIKTNIVTGVSHGTLTLNLNGTFTYTPNPDFNGSDSFTYELSDFDGDKDNAIVSITINPVNDVVDAINDSYSINEDEILVNNVKDNDQNLGDGNIIISLVSNVTDGTLLLNSTGAFTYTPDANFNGSDSFIYEIEDANGDTDQATVSLTIISVNDTPVAIDDNTGTQQNTLIEINVLANDNSLGDGVKSVVVSTPPDVAMGIAVVNPTNTITYTPETGYNGTAIFEYTVCDNDDECSTATVEIVVDNIDDLPVAIDDSDVTDEDVAITVDVLDNDGGLFDGGIVVTISSNPSNGAVNINPDNTIKYTPNADWYGTDVYAYEVCDVDNDCSIANVTITVNPVNDHNPVANNDSCATSINTDVTAYVLFNDTDLEDGEIIVTIETAPTSGSANVIDNNIVFTPEADFLGNVSLDYKVCDRDNDCDIATLNINVKTVNYVPDAIDDYDTTIVNNSLDVNVLANDLGLEDGIGAVSVNILPKHGSAFINSDYTLSYTPDVDFIGDDSLQYKVEDTDGDFDFDLAMLYIRVNAKPNYIPKANDDSCATSINTNRNINVLSNDEGLLDGGIVVTISSAPNPATGSVVVNGDNTLTFTPFTDYVGVSTFEYQVCDKDTECSTATVKVNVKEHNNMPVANDDVADTYQNEFVNIHVLDNDAGLGDGIKELRIYSSPSNGNAIVNTDNTVTYTPSMWYFGTDQFDYIVEDNDGDFAIATVTITITIKPNFVPVANDDSRGTTINTSRNIKVLLNDTGLDDGGIVLSIKAAPDVAEGLASVNMIDNSIDFTPATDFLGDAIFEYLVCDTDGDCDSAYVTIHVKEINYLPVAVNDSVSVLMNNEININVIANDLGLEDGIDEVTLFVEPVHGSAVVYGDNTIQYTPSNWYTGKDSLKYMVEDLDGDLSIATVYIEIEPLVNSIPIANDDLRGTSKNEYADINVLFNDLGLNDGGLILTIDNNPTNGTAIINPDNTIKYTPNADYIGTDNFEYHVCDIDGDCSATAIVTVNVKEVNIIPVAVDDAKTTFMDTPVTVNVLANDTKLFDGVKSVNVYSNPLNGNIVVNSDNTITYTPDNWYLGTDQFEYWVEDLDGDYSIATVTITIIEKPNYVPFANNDNRATSINTEVKVDVLTNDLGLEDGVKSLLVTLIPTNGSAVVVGDTIIYTPNTDYLGFDSFEYQVCDNDDECSSATVTINVKETNYIPEAVDDNATVLMNSSVDINVLSNDLYLNDGVARVTIYSNCSNGNLVSNSDNTITYIPYAWYTGTDSFEYMVTDLDGDNDIATVNITINEIPNYIPVANDDNRATAINREVKVDVLTNDTGLNDGVKSLLVTLIPTNGSAVVVGDTIIYTPNTDYLGFDSFEYEVCDIDDECATATVTINVKTENEVPDAVDDNAETIMNSAVDVNVLSNDKGLNDGIQDVTIFTDAANGTLVVNVDNTITYTPSSWYIGSDNFEYMVRDVDGDYDVATVNITINEIPNYIPIAIDDARGTSKNTPVIVDVLTNDQGLEDGVMSLSISSSPAEGNVVVNAGNTITYTPDNGYIGIDSFEYEVCDNDNECSTARVTINVREVNHVPVAIDDMVYTSLDTEVDIEVLGNDTGLEDVEIIVSIETNAINGSVVVNADQTVTYTPESWFEGTDNFTYRVTDADGDFDIANVIVVVMSGTLPGVSVSNVSGNTKEDGTTAQFTVVLETAPTADITISLDSDDKSEGVVSTKTLTFTAGNWSAVQTVTITGQDDNVDDGNQDYRIVTQNIVSTDPFYSGLSVKNIDVKNIDDDKAGINVSIDSTITNEDLLSTEISFVLNSEPLNDVSIEINSLDETEGVLTTDEVIFTPENWNEIQYIEVIGVNDDEVDGNIAYIVSILESVSKDPNYNGIDIDDISLINMDNDSRDLIIPDAFSPGNDGFNDYFEVVNLKHYDKASLRVYNRWGSLVYEDDNYQNDWDGKSNVGSANGSDLPTGTYYFVLNISGAGEEISGSVFIKR